MDIIETPTKLQETCTCPEDECQGECHCNGECRCNGLRDPRLLLDEQDINRYIAGLDDWD